MSREQTPAGVLRSGTWGPSFKLHEPDEEMPFYLGSTFPTRLSRVSGGIRADGRTGCSTVVRLASLGYFRASSGARGDVGQTSARTRSLEKASSNVAWHPRAVPETGSLERGNTKGKDRGHVRE